jgi:transposase-like protein
MARHEAAWWAERLKELARGGDAAEIAHRYGVREKTLIWWRSELPRRARKKPKQRLLPVVVAPPRVEPLRSELEVVVEVGPSRMILRGTVSAEHLAAIVAASARAC